MSDQGKVVCHQCDENYLLRDLKPTYNPEGEICGYICNPCRLKNAEYARRCQVSGCKTPDSRGQGFRTLPSKFYDLPEGEVKTRIVKQFGISKDTKACCNMCYVRISKSIVQMKIVYGDGVIRKGAAQKASQGSSLSTQNKAGTRGRVSYATKEPQAKTGEDRLSQYTGPQFKRRSVGARYLFDKVKSSSTNKPNDNVVDNVKLERSISNNFADIFPKSSPTTSEAQLNEQIKRNHNTVKSEDLSPTSDSLQKLDSNKNLPVVTTKIAEGGEDHSFKANVSSSALSPAKIIQSKLNNNFIPQGERQKFVTEELSDDKSGVDEGQTETPLYSIFPISPTTTRFRRILPKNSRQNSNESTDDHESQEGGRKSLSSPEHGDTRSRKSSSSSQSPTKGSSKDKTKKKKSQKRRRVLSPEVTSDIVSCMGCNKICSIKEAKPVFDYEKGFCGRLCNDCRIKKREENKHCPLKGCTTPLQDLILKPLPPKVQGLKGKLKNKLLTEFGITKDTKNCCRACWKKVNCIVNPEGHVINNGTKKQTVEPQTHAVVAKSETKTVKAINESVNKKEERIFTMCRRCYRIIPMKETVPNIEANGSKCGVLCYTCAGVTPNQGKESNNKQAVSTETEGNRPYYKIIGICKVKGCVLSGKSSSLVSCERLLKSLPDDKPVRKEFDIDKTLNLCCRSCLSRIKWFIGDPHKSESLAESVPKSDVTQNSVSNVSIGSTASAQKSVMPVESFTSQSILTTSVTSPIPTTVKAIKIPKTTPEASSLGPNPNCDLSQLPIYPVPSLPDFSGSTPVITTELPKSLPVTTLPVANVNATNIQRLPVSSVTASQSHKIPIAPFNKISAVTQQVPVMTSPLSSFGNRIIMPNPSPTVANVSPARTLLIPPTVTASAASHPPLLQVGEQQFVLNVICKSDKEVQTDSSCGTENFTGNPCKGVQVNVPIMPNFEGTVPASLPNGRKVKYIHAKDKTKYVIKRQGKELFEQFIDKMNEISGGCAHQLLLDIYKPKELTMASNYEKILASIGSLYGNTDRSNKQERLRLLSTVALHAPNEMLKKFFRRDSKKGGVISVNEAEIVQAREYAKQFGAGVAVMPVGQALPPSTSSNVQLPEEQKDDDENTESEGFLHPTSNETEVEHPAGVPSNADTDEVNVASEKEPKVMKPDSLSNVLQDSARTSPSNTENVPVKNLKRKIDVLQDENAQQYEEMDTAPLYSSNKAESNSNTTTSLNSQRLSSKKLKKSKYNESGKVKGKHLFKSKTNKKFLKNKKQFGKNSTRSNGNNSEQVRKKRSRVRFTEEEKVVLEEYFEQNMYVTKSLVSQISKTCGLDKKKIETWFRNRRSKAKKEELDKQLKEAACGIPPQVPSAQLTQQSAAESMHLKQTSDKFVDKFIPSENSSQKDTIACMLSEQLSLKNTNEPSEHLSQKNTTESVPKDELTQNNTIESIPAERPSQINTTELIPEELPSQNIPSESLEDKSLSPTFDLLNIKSHAISSEKATEGGDQKGPSQLMSPPIYDTPKQSFTKTSPSQSSKEARAEVVLSEPSVVDMTQISSSSKDP